ncbi:unnamed protein product [Ilex paraguariensis]|uniref:AIG1-type G domain-containing protein n=1 Tax=Ilex paraguariensis TaxID=185542 RepID=A0ABC8QT56_9AQUA
MASQLIREWTGIQQFPPATQTKLHELLGKLKQENVSTLTILVMGKGGVGKSSTVNSIIGERAVAVSAFQSEGPRPVMVSRSRAGFTLNIIDTPGLVEGGYVNDQALDIIKRFLLNKTIDVLLYVDRLDAYRVDTLDRQVVKAITDSFGREIWRRGLVVLTHAQLSPPDGLSYEEFFTRRSEALLKIVRLGARIRKQDIQGSSIPVVLVENSGRCNKNESDEKILPDGTTWIPNLVKTITDAVSNGSKGILVDKKLIEGPNPNDRGKLLIPLILAFQYFFVVKRIQKCIMDDIAKEVDYYSFAISTVWKVGRPTLLEPINVLIGAGEILFPRTTLLARNYMVLIDDLVLGLTFPTSGALFPPLSTRTTKKDSNSFSGFLKLCPSMHENAMWRLQSDWHSPTRLTTPVDYDFPGDRFIPNRSLMDLDQAHSLLTNRTSKEESKPKFSVAECIWLWLEESLEINQWFLGFRDEYRRKLEENLTLDSEGRPLRMLVFRGSPKSSRKSGRLIDEMRRSDEDLNSYNNKHKQHRSFPKRETRILDAPKIKDDYYLNIMDWGKINIVAIALGSELYLWNAENSKIHKLLSVFQGDNYPTSVAWSDDAKILAAGHMFSQILLWDAETGKLVRNLDGHEKRVGTIAWNDHILTSGSHDKSIINHDVRARNSLTSRLEAHSKEVCGLKWSRSGKKLASGGDDNVVHIWDSLKMGSNHFMHRFNNHCAAVKALSWCPYDSDVLASGGGIADGCIKLWNTQKGTCISSVDTNAQASQLAFSVFEIIIMLNG